MLVHSAHLHAIWTARLGVTILIVRRASARSVLLKILATVLGSLIGAFGALGIVAPSDIGWIAMHSLTSGAFYLIAAVRVAFAVILILAAPLSRTPTALRTIGYIILVAGITTALMGSVAMERAHAIVDWWLQQGSGVVRLTCLLVSALGAFIAYVCAPVRQRG